MFGESSGERFSWAAPEVSLSIGNKRSTSAYESLPSFFRLRGVVGSLTCWRDFEVLARILRVECSSVRSGLDNAEGCSAIRQRTKAVLKALNSLEFEVSVSL